MKTEKNNLIDGNFLSSDANIFILGARGYTKRYGGWETFVHGLIDNYPDHSHRFIIFEIVSSKDDEDVLYFGNVCCIRVFIKPCGNLSMVLFDRKCLRISLKIIKNQNVVNPSLFFLGPRIGPYLRLLRHKIRSRNIRLVENPAGIEWKRSKWNWIVKKYVILSSLAMANSVDVLTCDSQAVADVYKEMKVRSEITFIPYGCYLSSASIPQNSEEIIAEWGLQKNQYFLVLGRFVPENNIEMILQGYLSEKRQRKLVIVSNIDKESKYFQKIQSLFSSSPHWEDVLFIPSCYEQIKILSLRANCYSYVHGHSVGGTNPGLLEAMAVTNLSFLFDCPFTREVGGDCALYFASSADLSKLMDTEFDSAFISEIGQKAKRRMNEKYRWSDVALKYSIIFSGEKPKNVK